jgi:hypothetical protein
MVALFSLAAPRSAAPASSGTTHLLKATSGSTAGPSSCPLTGSSPRRGYAPDGYNGQRSPTPKVPLTWRQRTEPPEVDVACGSLDARWARNCRAASGVSGYSKVTE